MHEDLRDRFRSRASSEPARRSVSRPLQRPTVVARPAPAQEPTPEPQPTVPTKATPAPAPAPKPAKKRRPRSKKWPFIIIAGVVVVLLAGAGYFVFTRKQEQAKASQAAAKAPTFPGISFPIYYPTNLPPGYTFNKDFKVLKDNVLYYSVTDPKGNNFYVTLQPIPTAFNFSAFNSKFLKPNQYSTNVGSVVAGQAGANFIGSIQTDDNVWIIINTDAKDVGASLEAITRSFEAAKD